MLPAIAPALSRCGVEMLILIRPDSLCSYQPQPQPPATNRRKCAMGGKKWGERERGGFGRGGARSETQGKQGNRRH